MHPTSLPGGRLGEEAFAFVDWLAEAGQSWWQVLPLGPVGEGGSPYKAPSAFAGSPTLLADPEAPVAAAELDALREREAYWLPDWEAFAGRGRGRGPGPLRPRVDGAARVRGGARRADHRRPADLRRRGRLRPPRPPGALPDRRPGRRPARRFHRRGPALGQPALRLAGAAAAALPLVGRAAAAHLAAGRPLADRPLPRLRRLLVGARRRPPTPRGGHWNAARAGRSSTRSAPSSATCRWSPRTSARSPSRSNACAANCRCRGWR